MKILQLLFTVLILQSCASNKPPEPRNKMVFDSSGMELMKKNPNLLGPWTFYTMHLGVCSKTKAGSGIQSIPSFKCEKQAREMMAGRWIDDKRKNSSIQNKYLDELAEIKAMNYMSEYVWVYLKRESWKDSSPQKLAAFKAWANQNLKSHIVETYKLGSMF